MSFQRFKNPLFFILLFALSITVFFALTACTANAPEPAEPPPDGVSKATESRYSAAEIREYEGIRLDPARGPRDNSITGIQIVKLDTYALTITGLVDQELSYTYQDVLELPAYQRLITLYCVEGWDATVLWEGARLADILEPAGVQDAAVTVIFHCVDGYATSLPLETVQERDLLLAYHSNGMDLPAALGFPFILVAEDKLGYKWARWVTEIELSEDSDYKGFWEERGYSNDAELK